MFMALARSSRCGRVLHFDCVQRQFQIAQFPSRIVTSRRCFGVKAGASPPGEESVEKAKDPSIEDLAKAVADQQKMLFPRMGELERANEAVNTQDWSPQQLPYKTFDKHSSANDSDDEEESDDDDEAVAKVKKSVTEAATSSASTVARFPKFHADGVDDQDDFEEGGFNYRGPEPTMYRDWAHKGRCTDF